MLLLGVWRMLGWGLCCRRRSLLLAACWAGGSRAGSMWRRPQRRNLGTINQHISCLRCIACCLFHSQGQGRAKVRAAPALARCRCRGAACCLALVRSFARQPAKAFCPNRLLYVALQLIL